MKKHITIILILLLTICLSSFAQIYNTEAIYVPNGTALHIKGNLYNKSGVFDNEGTIILTGNFTNDTTFNSGNNSTVILEGAYQYIGGLKPTTFNQLVVDGTSHKQYNIDGYIRTNLHFNYNNLILGNNNLILMPHSNITGYSNTSFVVTDGHGFLVKKSVPLDDDFIFPVGDSINSFKPVTLNYSGTVDTFSVRVMKNVVPTTGADERCVQYTYIIEESNPGGTDAALSLGWSTLDEGSSFNRENAFMWQYAGNWQLIPYEPGALHNFPLTDWHYSVEGVKSFSPSASRFIIWENSEMDIFIPNIFSPNNDGYNDVLYVRGPGIKNLIFVVYNRWGEKIFESNNVNYGWDGTYKGQALTTGVFTYYVKATGYGGNSIEKKGNVTLVK